MIKKICLLMVIFMSLTLSSCTKQDELMGNYPSLTDKKHVIKTINAETAVKKVSNQESFILLLGFEACPWCQAIMPEYNEAAKELGINEVYYLDILDMRDNPDSSDRIYYLALENYFSEAKDQAKNRMNAPTILGIKNGKLVGYHLNTVASHIKNESGILPPMTDEQKTELKLVLTEIFNKVYK